VIEVLQRENLTPVPDNAEPPGELLRTVRASGQGRLPGGSRDRHAACHELCRRTVRRYGGLDDDVDHTVQAIMCCLEGLGGSRTGLPFGPGGRGLIRDASCAWQVVTPLRAVG
jgi:hypothetical protein